MAWKISVLCAILAVLATTRCAGATRRDLDYSFNEGCDDLCKNTKIKLAHVRATGPNDTLHYLWDFTENPTILIVVTSVKAKLQINWSDYLAKKPYSLNFTEKPIYSLGVAVERLLEFNDIKDQGRIDQVNKNNITELKFENFKWSNKTFSKHENFVEFYAEASDYKNPANNDTRQGKVKFLMQGFGSVNHSHVIPCMLHSENSTQVDIVIDQLDTKKEYSNSRFAMELLIISESNPDLKLKYDTKRKLDDEFTPGIFESIELSTPYEEDKWGYLQWIPVSYISPDRDVTNSSGTIFYPVKNATPDDYFSTNNLLYMYYGESMFNYLSQRINISLGQGEDSFYKDTKYASWTFLTGYGTPPAERFSNIVITIITIGGGLPVLILMVSGIYVCMRRIRRNANEYIQQS